MNKLIIISAVLAFTLLVSFTSQKSLVGSNHAHASDAVKEAPDFMEGYEKLLEKYVDANGHVDYKGLKTEQAQLEALVKGFGGVTKTQFEAWSRKQQLNFLMDTYNIYTLALIVRHYPLKSIMDINPAGKIWDEPIWDLLGEKTTLNAIEHVWIRPIYKEPRIHFTLVCAAEGCPPLQRYMFQDHPDMDKAYEAPIKAFLNHNEKFRIDRQNRKVYVSKLFEWYGDDYLADHTPANGFAGSAKQKAVLNFFADYLSESDANWLRQGGYQVHWLEYDWALNEQK